MTWPEAFAFVAVLVFVAFLIGVLAVLWTMNHPPK